MKSRAWCLLLVAALVLTPGAARSQHHTGGSGGGHNHGSQESEPEKGSRADRKKQESIQKVLDDPRGRELLAEAVLADEAFTRGLLARMATVPELRALVLALFEARTDGGGAARQDSITAAPPARPPETAVIYTCTMHPDVRAPGPGTCPKCGMSLVPAPVGAGD